MSREYVRVTAPAGGLRLHLNENTAGCSPRVIEALASLTREDAAFYPDYDTVVAATAARLAVPADHIVLTNGLDDGILALAVAAFRNSAASNPDDAIVVVPAFDMYAACTDAVGGRIVEVQLNGDFSFPLDRVIATSGPRTKAIFVTNPHNPTGVEIAVDDLFTIAAAAQQALVFVDEAYIDFGGRSVLADPRFARHENIVVGRTFAKAYGLAGLRAGAVIASRPTLAAIRRTVPPYTLNVCSAAAIPAAFADVEYYDWYVGQVRESRALMYATLDRLGVPYWPSAANFVLARFGPDVARIVAGLARRNVAVRDRSRDPGCDGCARLTTGVVDHTRLLVAALEEVWCERA